MNDLTAIELSDFTKLRATVARTKESAAEFYDALTQIHARKLYRAEFKTWDAFCQSELGTTARTVHLRLNAHAIRKEIGSSATEITNRTALALKNVKAVSRPKVLRKATEIAAGKPVTPQHVAQATGSQQRDYSGSWTSHKETTIPTTKSPAIPAASDATLPPISDTLSAVAAIEAAYQRDKLWFNDISTGKPRTPRDIIDRLIAALQQ